MVRTKCGVPRLPCGYSDISGGGDGDNATHDRRWIGTARQGISVLGLRRKIEGPL